MAFGTTSARNRNKLANSAVKLLPAGTVVRDVGSARGSARMTIGAAVVIGLFSVGFVIALAAGTVIVPGGALIYFTFASVRPQRVVVVAEQRLAVFSRSLLTGRLAKVVEDQPLSAWTLQGDGPVVVIGSEELRFAGRELDRLERSLAGLRQTAAA